MPLLANDDKTADEIARSSDQRKTFFAATARQPVSTDAAIAAYVNLMRAVVGGKG